MLAPMSPSLLLSLVALPLLLLSERRGSLAGKWVFKPLASLGFIGLSLERGALEHPWGQIAFASFLLCALGDVLLIPADKRAFLAGLVSFLLGHVGFAIAFALRGLQPAPLVWALPALILLAAIVLRWLWPHLVPKMRLPVLAYILGISVMVLAALCTVAWLPSPALIAGATLFFVSDLFVARNRFVQPGFINRAFGLPLYYAGTLLLAWASGGPRIGGP